MYDLFTNKRQSSSRNRFWANVLQVLRRKLFIRQHFVIDARLHIAIEAANSLKINGNIATD